MLLEARTSTPLKRSYGKTLSHVESPISSQPVLGCIHDDDNAQVDVDNAVSDTSFHER